MSELNRRDFLKMAGAGSAALVAIGAGVVATGKVLKPGRAGSGTDGPVQFRATAGLPQQPYPPYASLVFEGSVDPAAGTGTIQRSVYAGAPDAMSTVIFPGTERSYDVTSISRHGDGMLVRAKVANRSTLDAGESPTILVRVDQRTGEVQAPFVDRQLTLSAD
jgi:hypothetical protein